MAAPLIFDAKIIEHAASKKDQSVENGEAAFPSVNANVMQGQSVLQITH